MLFKKIKMRKLCGNTSKICEATDILQVLWLSLEVLSAISAHAKMFETYRENDVEENKNLSA